ncbi:hypothetical protein CJD38_03680 [Stenotrophobium rhamnosiphilum]|uniref:Uncharacterized protein n=2 Tax=Stenotrophobium rhamnosiphilum TaxID=2029166 RepID=A0A2T5MKV6_9GAMM|nr:hypothetical protein CJD38_03680 [Stenotrophobium rhamnosiphilum]
MQLSRHAMLALTLLLSPAWVQAATADVGDDKASAIKGVQKVAIAEFGVEFYTQMGGGSNQSGTSAFMTSSLRGVADSDFQTIADQAYADTVAALKEAGFEVVDPAVLTANSGYQELVQKYGNEAPYSISDSTFGKGDPWLSKIFTSQGLKAFYSGSNKTNRGTFGQRFDSQNQKRGSIEGDVAKSLGATLLHVHYIVGFATIKDHGHKVLFSTGSAKVKSEWGTNLSAQDTEWQFVTDSGARTFTTSTRPRHSGAVYLDSALQSDESIYTGTETTSGEQKRSDGVANAVSMTMGLLLGNSSIDSTKKKTYDVTANSAEAYRKDAGQVITTTATAFAKALGAAK